MLPVFCLLQQLLYVFTSKPDAAENANGGNACKKYNH